MTAKRPYRQCWGCGEQRQIVRGDRCQSCLDKIDAMIAAKVSPARKGSTLYCEDCERQVPASEFNTDLWEHIACPSRKGS